MNIVGFSINCATTFYNFSPMTADLAHETLGKMDKHRYQQVIDLGSEEDAKEVSSYINCCVDGVASFRRGSTVNLLNIGRFSSTTGKRIHPTEKE
jgi:hypothetical protein